MTNMVLDPEKALWVPGRRKFLFLSGLALVGTQIPWKLAQAAPIYVYPNHLISLTAVDAIRKGDVLGAHLGLVRPQQRFDPIAGVAVDDAKPGQTVKVQLCGPGFCGCPIIQRDSHVLSPRLEPVA